MIAVPRNILVTGSSGFVGRHLTKALADAYPSAKLVTPNLRIEHAGEVDQAIRDARPDVVVHLAAVSYVGDAQHSPDQAWRVNFNGTLNVAWSLCRHAADCQFLFVSSSDAYGATFMASEPLDETAPLSPMNVYAETKAAADLVLGGLAAQGLRAIRLRAFNHTGPGQSAKFVVPAFARQIARIKMGLQSPILEVGNLATWRDFLDVRDVCAAYVACIAARDTLAPGTILNVASGHPRRVGDILDALIARAGVEIEVKVDPTRLRGTDIRMACGNPARAHERLGWMPSIPWEQTLDDVMDDWFSQLAARTVQDSP